MRKIFYILPFLIINLISFCYPTESDSTSENEAVSPLAVSNQMILIITQNWEDSAGILYRYERNKLGGEWKQIGNKYSVMVGTKGLAWGMGLHGTNPDEGPVKHEGDGKAPAGVFNLSGVFGYESSDKVKWLNMTYTHVDSCIECIDDANSKYYNTIIDNRKIQDKDWSSSEIMHLRDDGYKLGIFVDHNYVPRIKNGGSCIFIHIWEKKGIPTSGCSAIKEENLINILHWMNKDSNPVLVQLPQKEYKRFKIKWELP